MLKKSPLMMMFSLVSLVVSTNAMADKPSVDLKVICEARENENLLKTCEKVITVNLDTKENIECSNKDANSELYVGFEVSPMISKVYSDTGRIISEDVVGANLDNLTISFQNKSFDVEERIQVTGKDAYHSGYQKLKKVSGFGNSTIEVKCDIVYNR